MALIQPSMDLSNPDGPASLFLNAPGMEELEVKVPPADCKPTDTVKYVAWFHTGPFFRGGVKILCSQVQSTKKNSVGSSLNCLRTLYLCFFLTGEGGGGGGGGGIPVPPLSMKGPGLTISMQGFI